MQPDHNSHFARITNPVNLGSQANCLFREGGMTLILLLSHAGVQGDSNRWMPRAEEQHGAVRDRTQSG
jgi:hypothetical protein